MGNINRAISGFFGKVRGRMGGVKKSDGPARIRHKTVAIDESAPRRGGYTKKGAVHVNRTAPRYPRVGRSIVGHQKKVGAK